MRPCSSSLSRSRRSSRSRLEEHRLIHAVETALFKPLSLEEIEQIVDLLLADVNRRLVDKRVTVSLDTKAKEWVAEKGYDPVFGARPLKRFLQRHLETRLARALISGEVGEDPGVTFKVKGDELVLA